MRLLHVGFLPRPDPLSTVVENPLVVAFSHLVARLRRQLTPEASRKVRKGNYERIFDNGRNKVRAWENAHVQ